MACKITSLSACAHKQRCSSCPAPTATRRSRR
jgi:hypothetical protein